MRTRCVIVALLGIFLFSLLTLNTFSAAEEVNLGEVVVQATKSGTKLKDVPATTYIITDKQIKETTDERNIGDVLWSVPGIFSQDKRHTDANVLYFRGITLHDHVTYGILVLIDGIPINNADGWVDFEGIDFNNIKRIEVIKGPVSALYGPDGTVGVINIVTKNPPKKLTFKASGSYGSYKTWKVTTSAGKTFGSVGVLLDAMRYGSVGYRPRNSNYETKLGGKVKADLGDLGDLIFNANYVNTDKDIPGPLNESQFLSREKIATRKFAGSSMELYRTGIAYKKGWDTSLLNLNLYYHGKTYDGGYSDSWVEHYYLNLFGGETRFIQLYNIGGIKNKLTVGVSGYTESGTTKIWARNSDGSKGRMLSKVYGLYRSGGIYGQNTTTIVEPLKVTLGLRYDTVYYKYEDKYPSSGTDTRRIHAWSPKFGVTYEFKKNQILYMDIGKGFIPPTLRELFTSRYANKDLKPQYLTDYEMGVRGTLASKLRYELAVYYMKFKDQIQYDPNTNTYENIGNTKHKGFETSLSFRVSRYITLSGNYSFNISRFDNDPVYGNNFVKKAPKHTMALGAIYRNGGLSLGVWLRRIWKYYMDNENTKYYGGHTIVNAKVSYQWKNVFASLYVNNLLDSNYAAWSTRYHFGRRIVDYYYPGWPINIMFTLGVKF